MIEAMSLTTIIKRLMFRTKYTLLPRLIENICNLTNVLYDDEQVEKFGG